ncbi:CLUMA_CG011952, isoform A [Clunio marinus]|uniref:CLUMA_CG011952, isoform A n=1 Tax=Clunio marinus TaxID=568069 RepID=A0A1J1IGS5_9DIPT|nr:CLUMA_CG011952, isoform A [Clunio marinus]
MLLLVVLPLIFIENVDLKFMRSDDILRNLITYDSVQVKRNHEKLLGNAFETQYYSPFKAIANSSNDTESHQMKLRKKPSIRFKRKTDSTFRGRPKTIQEVWSRNFNISTQQFSQSTSLVTLMNKIILKYMSACIPVILYDEYVEKSEGFILLRLFQNFPTSFIHGKIGKNFTIENDILLDPPHIRCRSYILFVSDALKSRQVVGPQIESKVIIVPRSTQWKLQEFLSSPLSRDIINLLIIGESYSTDLTKERPYVLYTHQLYVDGLGSNKPKVLTSWLKGKLSRPHIDLFPVKLRKGFAGHRYSVAAVNFPPFVFKKLSTDGVGNLHIEWSLNQENLKCLEIIRRPGDAVGLSISKRQHEIGMSGMYVTTERNSGTEMSVSHSTDCAAFITLTSKALPRYRAILGPFQWQVWVCLTFTYLIAIIPLAYSDSLSIKYLIEKPGQIENMFWYVFGTFTNSLTFSGELSWSNSKKTSTRLLIGFYWVFTIIITACYTGSIIAFVTLPVFPETVDTIRQLRNGFYRVGTLDRGGWERWFVNSSHPDTVKVLQNLELVKNLQEGLGNVTKPYFLFPYAFIGSKAQLNFIVQTNYSDDKLGRHSTLHISDQCFALFGVSFVFQRESVLRDKINHGILILQQSGIINKIKNDVRWDMVRSSTGKLLQISEGKTLRIANQEERGLTLADTEGMFLLLGIGFLIAGAALISEWVGGCTNKCMQFMRVKREQEEETHRIEEEKENARVEAETARLALKSASSVIGITFSVKTEDEKTVQDGNEPQELKPTSEVLSGSSRNSRHSRSDSITYPDLNAAMLSEMYHGPKTRASNIIMMDGKMMSESDANEHANQMKKDDEMKQRLSDGGSGEVLRDFDFLNNGKDEDADEDKDNNVSHHVCEVEINLQAPTDTEFDN